MTREEAWGILVASAQGYANNPDKHFAKALSSAAIDWGKVNAAGVVKGTRGNTLRSGAVIPFGKSKGVAIEEADVKDLRWVAGALSASIEDPAKERWAPQNRALLVSIEAELETR